MAETTGTATSDLMNAPAATPGPVTTQQAREQAFSVMQRLRADDDYRASYLRGDVATKAEVTAAHATINTPTALKVHGKSAPEDRASMIGSLEKFASIPPAVQQQLYQGDAVSEQEQKWARAERARVMADKEFVRAYLDGGRAQRERLLLLNAILSSPTKTT